MKAHITPNKNSNILNSFNIKAANDIIINSVDDVSLIKATDRKYEYTPLQKNYLYFNGTENSYGALSKEYLDGVQVAEVVCALVNDNPFCDKASILGV